MSTPGDGVLHRAPVGAGSPVRGFLPAELVVGEPRPDGRQELSDPVTRRRWRLGAVEYEVARRFVAGQTYGSISRDVRRELRRSMAPTTVSAFEERLLVAGVLRRLPAPDGVRTTGRLRATAVLLARRFVRWDLVAFDPSRALDTALGRAPWLTSRGVAALLCAGVASAGAVLGMRMGEFTREVPAALAGRGLLGLYAGLAGASVLHESGHALACRGHGVGVHEVGIGVRAFALCAWTEPEQRTWDGLPFRDRMITIVAGPLGSLAFAALGVLMWSRAGSGTTARAVGVEMVLAGVVGTVPTLIPVFAGDGYLVLTESMHRPDLRLRAFEHARMTLSGDRRAADVRVPARVGYLAFAAGSVIGHLALAGAVGWLLWTFVLAAG